MTDTDVSVEGVGPSLTARRSTDKGPKLFIEKTREDHTTKDREKSSIGETLLTEIPGGWIFLRAGCTYVNGTQVSEGLMISGLSRETVVHS